MIRRTSSLYIAYKSAVGGTYISSVSYLYESVYRIEYEILRGL